MINIDTTGESALSSPKNKGLRLKRVRNLANLSRKDIEARYGISIDTLKGWEVGRHGGLTGKGAQKIIELLSGEGVIVTVEWLLGGVGQGPKLLPIGATAPVKSQDEEGIIQAELQFFHANHENVADLVVKDDSMEPCYQRGDYVAGVKCFGTRISKLIGKDCIVELTDGSKLLRRISKINSERLLTAMCINPNTKAALPILQNINIVSAARVIWLRRP